MISQAAELTEAFQDLINAVSENNGCNYHPLPKSTSSVTKPRHNIEAIRHKELHDLVNIMDPDAGYDDWLRIGMVIYNCSGGDDDGLTLFDSWSAQGSKYPGSATIQTKWNSFDPEHKNPVTIRTLMWMIKNGVGVQND